METLRTIDLVALDAVADRTTIPLFTQSSSSPGVSCIKTPPGGGSRLGLHSHDFVQIIYLIKGTMEIEIDGERAQATAGSVVVFPAGVPHRNWNEGSEATIHLSVTEPAEEQRA